MKQWTSTTGLAILEGPVTMYRVSVARAGRGPLNPRERPADPGDDRKDWSRFDTPGLTIYGASRRDTAFTESLAFKAPSAHNYASLVEIAQDQGISLDQLLDELRSAGIPVDGMEPDWRLTREIFTLQFPDRLWVDLTHPDTVQAIKGSGIAAADRLTVSDLTGDERAVTTLVAQWIRAQQLEGGQLPAGIRYPSKFGFSEGDYCWAAFIPAPNTGCTVCSGEGFAANDPDLRVAVRRTGVNVT